MKPTYKGLDNRNLRLLSQSDAELVFQKYKKFIWIFQKSKDLADAARRLSMNRRQVANRASLLRRAGIPLKVFNKQWELIPTEKIKELAILASGISSPVINYEKFVRLWQSKGPRGVQKEFGINRYKASYLASWLRKKCDIPLANYHTAVDRKRLQQIADETATSSSPIPPHRKSPGSPK